MQAQHLRTCYSPIIVQNRRKLPPAALYATVSGCGGFFLPSRACQYTQHFTKLHLPHMVWDLDRSPQYVQQGTSIATSACRLSKILVLQRLLIKDTLAPCS